MRRLLPAIVTVGLLLGFAAPAMAASRLPRGVAKVSVTLTFPPRPTPRKPETTTITNATSVAAVVSATNGLQVAVVRGACPMFILVGPDLTVVFRNASGAIMARATTQVTLGSHGDNGSNPCFPIHFLRKGIATSLLGHSWIRLMGRMLGTAIS